jgi:hypothetical protein
MIAAVILIIPYVGEFSLTEYKQKRKWQASYVNILSQSGI